MPVLDGRAEARRIRRAEHALPHHRVPILVCKSSSPTKVSLRAFGIDGVLAKPCDLLALHRCLALWCADKHRRKSALVNATLGLPCRPIATVNARASLLSHAGQSRPSG